MSPFNSYRYVRTTSTLGYINKVQTMVTSRSTRGFIGSRLFANVGIVKKNFFGKFVEFSHKILLRCTLGSRVTLLNGH